MRKEWSNRAADAIVAILSGLAKRGGYPTAALISPVLRAVVRIAKEYGLEEKHLKLLCTLAWKIESKDDRNTGNKEPPPETQGPEKTSKEGR